PASGTKIVTDRVSPARVRHLPQVAPRRNLPAGLGRPRGLRRGSAYGSFPAVHQPRRNLSLWRGILLFAASLSRFGFSAEVLRKISATSAGVLFRCSFFPVFPPARTSSLRS